MGVPAHEPSEPSGRGQRPSGIDGSSAGDVALLVAELDGRRHCFRLSDVLEVQRMVEVVPLPGAPALVDGVIDARGRIVPVIDFRRQVGLGARQPTVSDQLILAEAGGRTAAIRVGSKVEVRYVPAAAIDTSTTAILGVSRILGVARDGGGLAVIHDLAGLLSAEEADQLDAVLRAGEDDG